MTARRCILHGLLLYILFSTSNGAAQCASSCCANKPLCNDGTSIWCNRRLFPCTPCYNLPDCCSIKPSLQTCNNVVTTPISGNKNALEAKCHEINHLCPNAFTERGGEYVYPRETLKTSPIHACVAGYDGEIFKIIDDIKQTTGTEIEVHFYIFHKCKFHVLNSHMTNIKDLQDVLSKYHHYICLNKKYLETSYNSKDHCWYIEKLILIPSFNSEVDLLHKDLQVQDFSKMCFTNGFKPLALEVEDKCDNLYKGTKDGEICISDLSEICDKSNARENFRSNVDNVFDSNSYNPMYTELNNRFNNFVCQGSKTNTIEYLPWKDYSSHATIDNTGLPCANIWSNHVLYKSENTPKGYSIRSNGKICKSDLNIIPVTVNVVDGRNSFGKDIHDSNKVTAHPDYEIISNYNEATNSIDNVPITDGLKTNFVNTVYSINNNPSNKIDILPVITLRSPCVVPVNNDIEIVNPEENICEIIPNSNEKQNHYQKGRSYFNSGIICHQNRDRQVNISPICQMPYSQMPSNALNPGYLYNFPTSFVQLSNTHIYNNVEKPENNNFIENYSSIKYSPYIQTLKESSHSSESPYSSLYSKIPYVQPTEIISPNHQKYSSFSFIPMSITSSTPPDSIEQVHKGTSDTITMVNQYFKPKYQEVCEYQQLITKPNNIMCLAQTKFPSITSTQSYSNPVYADHINYLQKLSNHPSNIICEQTSVPVTFQKSSFSPPHAIKPLLYSSKPITTTLTGPHTVTQINYVRPITDSKTTMASYQKSSPNMLVDVKYIGARQYDLEYKNAKILPSIWAKYEPINLNSNIAVKTNDANLNIDVPTNIAMELYPERNTVKPTIITEYTASSPLLAKLPLSQPEQLTGKETVMNVEYDAQKYQDLNGAENYAPQMGTISSNKGMLGEKPKNIVLSTKKYKYILLPLEGLSNSDLFYRTGKMISPEKFIEFQPTILQDMYKPNNWARDLPQQTYQDLDINTPGYQNVITNTAKVLPHDLTRQKNYIISSYGFSNPVAKPCQNIIQSTNDLEPKYFPRVSQNLPCATVYKTAEIPVNIEKEEKCELIKDYTTYNAPHSINAVYKSNQPNAEFAQKVANQQAPKQEYANTYATTPAIAPCKVPYIPGIYSPISKTPITTKRYPVYGNAINNIMKIDQYSPSKDETSFITPFSDFKPYLDSYSYQKGPCQQTFIQPIESLADIPLHPQKDNFLTTAAENIQYTEVKPEKNYQCIDSFTKPQFSEYLSVPYKEPICSPQANFNNLITLMKSNINEIVSYPQTSDIKYVTGNPENLITLTKYENPTQINGIPCNLQTFADDKTEFDKIKPEYKDKALNRSPEEYINIPSYTESSKLRTMISPLTSNSRAVNTQPTSNYEFIQPEVNTEICNNIKYQRPKEKAILDQISIYDSPEHVCVTPTERPLQATSISSQQNSPNEIICTNKLKEPSNIKNYDTVLSYTQDKQPITYGQVHEYIEKPKLKNIAFYTQPSDNKPVAPDYTQQISDIKVSPISPLFTAYTQLKTRPFLLPYSTQKTQPCEPICSYTRPNIAEKICNDNYFKTRMQKLFRNYFGYIPIKDVPISQGHTKPAIYDGKYIQKNVKPNYQTILSYTSPRRYKPAYFQPTVTPWPDMITMPLTISSNSGKNKLQPATLGMPISMINNFEATTYPCHNKIGIKSTASIPFLLSAPKTFIGSYSNPTLETPKNQPLTLAITSENAVSIPNYSQGYLQPIYNTISPSTKSFAFRDKNKESYDVLSEYNIIPETRVFKNIPFHSTETMNVCKIPQEHRIQIEAYTKSPESLNSVYRETQSYVKEANFNAQPCDTIKYINPLTQSYAGNVIKYQEVTPDQVPNRNVQPYDTISYNDPLTQNYAENVIKYQELNLDQVQNRNAQPCEIVKYNDPSMQRNTENVIKYQGVTPEYVENLKVQPCDTIKYNDPSTKNYAGNVLKYKEVTPDEFEYQNPRPCDIIKYNKVLSQKDAESIIKYQELTPDQVQNHNPQPCDTIKYNEVLLQKDAEITIKYQEVIPIQVENLKAQPCNIIKYNDRLTQNVGGNIIKYQEVTPNQVLNPCETINYKYVLPKKYAESIIKYEEITHDQIPNRNTQPRKTIQYNNPSTQNVGDNVVPDQVRKQNIQPCETIKYNYPSTQNVAGNVLKYQEVMPDQVVYQYAEPCDTLKYNDVSSQKYAESNIKYQKVPNMNAQPYETIKYYDPLTQNYAKNIKKYHEVAPVQVQNQNTQPCETVKYSDTSSQSVAGNIIKYREVTPCTYKELHYLRPVMAVRQNINHEKPCIVKVVPLLSKNIAPCYTEKVPCTFSQTKPCKIQNEVQIIPYTYARNIPLWKTQGNIQNNPYNLVPPIQVCYETPQLKTNDILFKQPLVNAQIARVKTEAMPSNIFFNTVNIQNTNAEYLPCSPQMVANDMLYKVSKTVPAICKEKTENILFNNAQQQQAAVTIPCTQHIRTENLIYNQPQNIPCKSQKIVKKHPSNIILNLPNISKVNTVKIPYYTAPQKATLQIPCRLHQIPYNYVLYKRPQTIPCSLPTTFQNYPFNIVQALPITTQRRVQNVPYSISQTVPCNYYPGRLTQKVPWVLYKLLPICNTAINNPVRVQNALSYTTPKVPCYSLEKLVKNPNYYKTQRAIPIIPYKLFPIGNPIVSSTNNRYQTMPCSSLVCWPVKIVPCYAPKTHQYVPCYPINENFARGARFLPCSPQAGFAKTVCYNSQETPSQTQQILQFLPYSRPCSSQGTQGYTCIQQGYTDKDQICPAKQYSPSICKYLPSYANTDLVCQAQSNENSLNEVCKLIQCVKKYITQYIICHPRVKDAFNKICLNTNACKTVPLHSMCILNSNLNNRQPFMVKKIGKNIEIRGYLNKVKVIRQKIVIEPGEWEIADFVPIVIGDHKINNYVVQHIVRNSLGNDYQIIAVNKSCRNANCIVNEDLGLTRKKAVIWPTHYVNSNGCSNCEYCC